MKRRRRRDRAPGTRAARSTARVTSARPSSPARPRSGARGRRRACCAARRRRAASIATANSAALAAPALPMAKVATGMPLRHLHDRVERIDALQVPARTGTPSTGTVVLAASMPGRWAAPPAPAMMARQAARRGALGIGEHLVGHAVRRDDARFVGDAELGENLGRGAQGFPVAAGAHHHADDRGGAAHGVASEAWEMSLEL